METNYYFDTNETLKKLILQCIDELKQLGFPVPSSIYFREGKGERTYGLCYLGKYYNKYKNWEFVISINRYLPTEKDFKETIIHELLHTAETVFCHSGKWRTWANYVNANTDYHIAVTGNITLTNHEETTRKFINTITLTCPQCNDTVSVRKVTPSKSGATNYRCRKCNQSFYLFLPESPVKGYPDNQKAAFVDEISASSAPVDEISVLNALPYLSQTLRNKLLLNLLEYHTELFLSAKSKDALIYPILRTCDKKTVNALAESYLNDQNERLLNMTWEEYVHFSFIFSLTKNYIRVQEHWKALGHPYA